MTERFSERLFEFGAYRPKHEKELVDPMHVTKLGGKPFVPVRVYGAKPTLHTEPQLINQASASL